MAAGIVLASYAVEEEGAFQVTAAAPEVAVSPLDRHPDVALRDRPGDPVIRVSCPTADAEAVRYAQTHDPLHPDLPYRAAHAWPVAWAALGWTLAAAATTWALAGRFRRRS
jgi:hypothetical protein